MPCRDARAPAPALACACAARLLAILLLAAAAGAQQLVRVDDIAAQCPVSVNYDVNLGESGSWMDAGGDVPIFVGGMVVHNNAPAGTSNATIKDWELGWDFPFGSSIQSDKARSAAAWAVARWGGASSGGGSFTTGRSVEGARRSELGGGKLGGASLRGLGSCDGARRCPSPPPQPAHRLPACAGFVRPQTAAVPRPLAAGRGGPHQLDQRALAPHRRAAVTAVWVPGHKRRRCGGTRHG